MKRLIVAIIISLACGAILNSKAQVRNFPQPSTAEPPFSEPVPLPGIDRGLSKIPKELKHLSLTIDRHPGWVGDYEEGSPIRIRCTFKNMGHRSLTFRLADHDPYHGTQPYPLGMRVRVSSLAGVVLSATAEFGEWWTHYYRSSGVYLEMPGDRVILKPKEEVVRIVPVDEMLLGNTSLGTLKAGDYIIEIEIEGIVSNKMKVKIAPKR